MPANAAVHVMVVDGFADWEPAHALAELRRAFPTEFPRLADFDLAEPTDYPERGDESYAGLRRTFIDPIEQAYALTLRISTAIANLFGAHG